MRHKASTESASINIYLEDLATENHLVIFFRATHSTTHHAVTNISGGRPKVSTASGGIGKRRDAESKSWVNI